MPQSSKELKGKILEYNTGALGVWWIDENNILKPCPPKELKFELHPTLEYNDSTTLKLGSLRNDHLARFDDPSEESLMRNKISWGTAPMPERLYKSQPPGPGNSPIWEVYVDGYQDSAWDSRWAFKRKVASVKICESVNESSNGMQIRDGRFFIAGTIKFKGIDEWVDFEGPPIYICGEDSKHRPVGE
ncbi:hypothetical protein BGW36DRAFT_358161 [Talaromyces proteolyticus]|uniref:Uncharacterized protein n=1 Tax=Talaromyces proteolyticus TaxID=1131652 RepID=A0AAD4PZ48_9EURO|nr:uncharacterized protein BGW36DRAFT_358161 [Talaromyces proteolyticus]KAH8698636.1 hypothetical protein BGW36DRAFT_358161 [Talaromyces proteolyticus]